MFCEMVTDSFLASRAFRRGMEVWLAIMAAETAHGILRGIFLVPRIGEWRSSRVGWPVAAVVVVAVAHRLLPSADIHSRHDLRALGVHGSTWGCPRQRLCLKFVYTQERSAKTAGECKNRGCGRQQS